MIDFRFTSHRVEPRAAANPSQGMKYWPGVATVCGFLLLSLTACQTTPLPRWHWERVEAGLPRQAIVTAVVADPVDPDRLWVGYYGPDGLASSQDGGQTWVAGGAGLDGNPVFDLLVTAPHPPHLARDGSAVSSPLAEEGGRVVWAATRDGLLQSLDGGANWQPVTGNLPPQTAFALAADATGRVYVGLDNAGLYAESQRDSGWVPLAPDEPLASAAILSLQVSADGWQVYAGTAAQGVFASRDGGRTWVNTYPGRYVPNVALDPANPGLAVASLRDRLVRTRDGGQTWQTVPVPWAQDEIVSLLWLPDGTLGAGSGKGRLYRSRDGGHTWVEGGTGLPSGGGVLALAQAGGQSPKVPRRFLAGTWTGLYASGDEGQTWTQLAPSLGIPNAHTLLSVDNGLLLGTRAGLFRWQADTHRWEPVPAPFPAGGVTSLTIAPSDHRMLYAGTASSGVYRSDDGGASWQPVPSLRVGVPALSVDPTDPDHVYMLAAWERVYESRDGGQKWQARWEGLGVTTEATSLAVDPVGPTVYVGADAGLYRSRNGQDWQRVALDLADQSVLAIVVRPVPGTSGRGSALYIGTTRGAYRSLDGGDTVQHGDSVLGWGHGLQDVSVTAFLADANAPERLFAGTAYAGIYQSLDWGYSWHSIGPAELANEVVQAMAWGPDGELFVAAAGGVWRGVSR